MAAGPQDEEGIFHDVIAKPASERVAHLRAVCGDDSDLLAHMETLLQAYETHDDFLEVPPVAGGITLDPSPLTEGPGTVIGRYKLLERIGEGGMAVVYMAEQAEPIRRKVALKIIKLGMDTKQVIARFEAERQALAMMDHPNIAKVLDAGATEAGRPYFVMELVPGISITEYCDKNKLSTKDRLTLFVQVCNAVQHAHQKGIIHRDIKPSNVLVTKLDGEAVPKVIDFGIAKATSQRLTEKTLFTRYAQVIGTPAYMSPEQAEFGDSDTDTRSDIYSLGVLLYELLTGTTPFSEEELRKAGYLEMQRVIREEEPARPSTRLNTLGDTLTAVAKHRSVSPDVLRKALRGDLDWIVMKTLEKERARRYETANGLAEEVRRHLEHEPVLAGPPNAWYWAKKFIQRHRVWLTAGAAVTATIVLGFAVSASLYVRVEQVDFDRQLSVTQQLCAEGRYQAALAEMKGQGLNKASDARARLLYAQILSDLGRGDEAKTHLAGLTEAAPEIAGAAHYLLARLHLVTDVERSEEHRRRAEQVLPRTADGHALRALTAATPDEALKWLNEALKLDPSHYAARKARAVVHHGLRDYTSMLRDTEAMIAMRPKYSLGYALRALATRETGQPEEALFDHHRAIELCEVDSELPVLYDQRQETYWRLGDYEAALSDAQRCVALDPETVAYRAALGKILFRVGQYEAAKHEFDCIYAGGIWALALRDMVGYTFDTTIAGEPLAMPESLERSWPFFYMLQHADSCRALQQKASRLLRGAFDISSWSADGKRLAYTRSEFCGWGDNALDMAGPAGAVRRRGIEILDLESGRIRVLVTFGGEPAWSPDGCLIAFVRSPGLLREAEEEVWLIPAEGGEPRRLADGGCPCWTNHPTRLYFHSRIHEALCCIDVNNPAKEPSEIVRCPALYPDVSPDERYVAYATAGELRVVELSTGEELVKWVVPGWDRLCRVRWSPDGREISLGIMGRQAPYSGLWIFDPERKKGWHILDGPATSCNWSRDHSRVAIDMMFPVSEIWLAQIDPNLPTWEALGPAQTRAEYLRDNWQECVAWTPWSSLAHRMQVLRNLTAVGVNQYESGEYEDALWTLQHVAEVRQTQGALPDLETTAYMAMTLERLGRSQEAQQALERLRTFRVKAESTGETYLYEAEIKAVFEGSEYSVPQQ